VALENRLSTDQLEALRPGDAVTIECAGDLRRPRQVPGTVVRTVGSQIVVSVRGAKGVIYQERYRLRDGVREGNSPSVPSSSTAQRLPSQSFAVLGTSTSSTASGRATVPTWRSSADSALRSRSVCPPRRREPGAPA
jgi:hypothetical protein